MSETSRQSATAPRDMGALAPRLILPGLCILLVLTVTYAVTLGRYEIGFVDVWLILLDNLVPLGDASWTELEESVVELVRLPRILAALLIGAGLAVSGAALQGLFRNPLVDPGIIGVTSGAAFGGTLAILTIGAGYPMLAIAFAFGIGSMLVVRFLASYKGRTSILTLVLSGVIVSAFFEASISIIKLMADPHQKLPAITYWLMGSVASTNYRDLALIALAILPASVVIYALRYQINILSLGEDKARALGSPVMLVQWLVFACTAFISAGVVATSGIIGWVGLVIPHAARALVGAEHGRLLPASALMGAIYMILVDTVARTLTEAEIPIGIITALIGVPVFALLLRRLQRTSGWGID
ncbi:FecCD family ABC transporter permease [Ponticoccus litoralis]|uniref:Iron ABC transporter permease n=1 Tax=Ponticoccus litoralis TaxID=422297 RepID=A0AAW9SU65_9RHOB